MTLPLLLALAIAVVLFYWGLGGGLARNPGAARGTPPGGRSSDGGRILSARSAPDAGILGSWDGTYIVFDPGARKACIVVKGKTTHTVDCDYFRMWHLKWIEQFQGPLSPYLHVHFLFETSDFNRPTIWVNVSSKAEGDQWNAKLAILLQ